jgi:transposase
MKRKVRFLGLDVHAETIAVAIAETDGEVRSLGTIANRAESIRKLVKKLGPVEELKACYEAGPTGYVLYWQLAELGIACEVIAPTLVPMKAGDRVKTDRRDAERLVRSYRSGDLTPVCACSHPSDPVPQTLGGSLQLGCYEPDHEPIRRPTTGLRHPLCK